MKSIYSIEVDEDFVTIYGLLSIEETFDFLNFFERKGYSSVTSGHENSALRMERTSYDKKIQGIKCEELTHDIQTYQNLYEKEILDHEKTKARNKFFETLFKEQKSTADARTKSMQDLICELKKQIIELKLKNSEFFTEEEE